MDKFEALYDTERPMVAERRKKIHEDLVEATARDYFKINSALNAIGTLDYMEEINEVIQAAHQGHLGQISDKIRLLNRVRNPRQIREINQIILWVTFSIGPISEKHLLATLYRNIGEAPLQSLLARFQTKYLLFEVDSKGHVGFRSSEALNAIPHRRPAKKSDQRDNQGIQTGEINMIKHFLDKVCPPDVYKKLELDQYLQQKLTQKEDQIQQEDNDTGHLLLALDCLRALSKSRDTSVFALHEYAREHLIEHLASVDLAMVDRDQKSQVGELLVKLFSEDEHIDAFMWPETDDVVRTHKPRMTWVEESQNIDQVVR
ncbi:hypothetical protein N7530_009352 [Penicillium desertorum]|uniref:Uncharacterized protein n=1 Tax=Penicillium desertorum TaxID=1303715 RepID=A0A9X0BI01_9EURO|nr:hypothetical protein N7530_009352 [Penicillium desertorum]